MYVFVISPTDPEVAEGDKSRPSSDGHFLRVG